ncbi:MAG: radical SAM protein [Candidatus Aminicenantes bacterium]|nr:radical SAM protein [Candidatus Aminicenantes bacterium]
MRLNDWNLILEKNARTLIRGARLFTMKNFWRAWAQGTAYLLGRLSGRALPLEVCWAITYRCQCNCPHCYAAARKRADAGEMSTSESKILIDRIRDLGVVNLNFTGGEPLLRQDIVDLVAHANKRGLITRLTTNGDLLTRKVVAAMHRAGLNQCGISIDDADPDTHDRLRGLPGLFERAIEGFRHLHEFGIESRFMTYASRRNLPHGMERLMSLARRLRVDTVHINIPYASGLWADSFEETFSASERDRLRRFLGYLKSPLVLIEFPTPEARCIMIKRSYLYINASGDVTPCPVVPYVMGNVRDEPLALIWKRHAGLLRLDYHGDCPMNSPASREALRAHAAAVSSRIRRESAAPTDVNSWDCRKDN